MAGHEVSVEARQCGKIQHADPFRKICKEIIDEIEGKNGGVKPSVDFRIYLPDERNNVLGFYFKPDSVMYVSGAHANFQLYFDVVSTDQYDDAMLLRHKFLNRKTIMVQMLIDGLVDLTVPCVIVGYSDAYG